MKIEKKKLESLQQFYSLMNETREIRLRIVTAYLDGHPAGREDIESLENAAEALKALPATEGGAQVALDENRSIEIDLSYEITELEKDILFLSSGEEAFASHLAKLHPKHEEQTELGLSMLGSVELKNLITDRDGTVNNYCGRYLSSIQSVYNSVFISRFAGKCVRNAVILTSAPLENGGLVDITTIPKGIVINAGSKGREYRDKDFVRGTLPIDPVQQAKLNELNERLRALLSEPRYEKFGLIGSALQLKFGQTTIARQDVTGSVPEEESATFLQLLEGLVGEMDPDHHYFRIEDTGLDVEIILTVPTEADGGELTDFSKGSGVGFLNDRLGLNLAAGHTLVCGDTGSDVPMLEECLRHSDDTWSIFVTKKEDLANRVRALTSRSLIVDEPDTLVAIMNDLARKARS